MRILLDHNVPAPLVYSLRPNHVVETALDRGWEEYTNGDLIEAAEAAGFELRITTDRGIRYQQNLSKRKIALLLLSTNDWTRIRRVKHLIAEAVDAMGVSVFQEFAVPRSQTTG